MGGKEHLWSKYLLLVILSLCLIFPVVALGQDEDEEEKEDLEFELEDVVVTAEKREVELQKIPMDVSVVRPDDMRMYNINQMYDLQKMLPDLSIVNTVGTFNLISIREVQTMLFNPIYETTVATHIDGIQLGRFAGLDNFFFDLERVEVLKGPQGTLYGRGSTAGSMNMITRKPILGEWSGNASMEAGNYSRYRADWAVNAPLGDTMALRLAGRSNRSDGYSDSGYGNANSFSHRLSWRWEPNDRLIINLSADIIEQDDNGMPMAGFSAMGYYFDTYGDVEIVAHPDPTAVVDARYQSGGPVRTRGQANWALQNSADENVVDSEHYGIQGLFSYAFDFATASLEWGHRTLHEHKDFMWAGASLFPVFGGPPPYTQAYVTVMTPTIFMFNDTSGNTNTAEIRLTSNTTIAGGDKLEWIAGIMGQRDMTREIMHTTGEFWFDVQIKTQTEGAFVQASWMPLEKWNLTGGVRWNSDSKYYHGNYMVDDFSYFDTQADWSKLTYRANLSWFPTDDVMPYLTYSRGYRTGNLEYRGTEVPPEFLNAWELGFKSRFFDNKLQFNAGVYFYDYKNYSNWIFVSKCWADTDDYFDWNTFTQFTPGDHACDDVAGNPAEGYGEYEPATDTRYPDGQVNNWDYEYSVYAGYSPGGAEQKGLSLNIQYLPTMDDRVSLSASWSNNEYKSPYDPRAAVLAAFPDADSPYLDYSENPDLGGYEFGGAPIRGNLSYTHTFRFDSGDTLMVTGTGFYEGEGIDRYLYRTYPEEYSMPGRDDYWTADVSLMYSSTRWMSPGNLWGIRFSAQNIFDNDALSSISYSPYWFNRQFPYAERSGTISGSYINPRTYSITFDINF